MKYVQTTFLAILLSCTTTVFAQTPDLKKHSNRDVIRMGLYPPDILMRQQERLGITDKQRTSIANLVREFQGNVTELQWSMPGEQQKLRRLLNQPTIDAQTALTQAEAVLTMENEFKLAHFKLLIAVKNELTVEQIEALDGIIKRRLQGSAQR